MEESDFHKRLKSTGRNDQCLCGSGKKYKKCHLNEDERMEHEEFKKREEALKVAEHEVSELEKEDTVVNDSSGRKKSKVDNSFQPLASKSRGTKGIKSTSIPRRPAN
jgi:SEC-C motif